MKARLTATGFDASREVIELISASAAEGQPARSEAGDRHALAWSSPANWMWTMSSALWLTWRCDVGELPRPFRAVTCRVTVACFRACWRGGQAPRLSAALEDVHAPGSIFTGAPRRCADGAGAAQRARVRAAAKAMEVTPTRSTRAGSPRYLKQCATLDAQSQGQAPGDACG